MLLKVILPFGPAFIKLALLVSGSERPRLTRHFISFGYGSARPGSGM